MVFPDTFGPKLREGAIAVILTDTIYGVVTSAWRQESVEAIYRLKKRSPEKPCIILVADITELTAFGVTDSNRKKIIQTPLNGPTSFIVPIDRNDLFYLDRGTKTLAFRIPQDTSLIELLRVSGPLIAPSANPEGLSPATTIEEAKKYFGDDISLYMDGGFKTGAPSALINVATGRRLR